MFSAASSLIFMENRWVMQIAPHILKKALWRSKCIIHLINFFVGSLSKGQVLISVFFEVLVVKLSYFYKA